MSSHTDKQIPIIGNWFLELKKLGASAQVEGFTSEELSLAIGRSKKLALEAIKQGMAAGLIEYAGRRNATRVDGQAFTRPAWRVVRKGKK